MLLFSLIVNDYIYYLTIINYFSLFLRTIWRFSTVYLSIGYINFKITLFFYL